MPGFIRRFGFFPGTETITQIEGVVIVDLPPPGSVEGVDTGVVALVGEFADNTFAVDVDGTGAVTTKVQPQEVISTKDLTDKFGGFDPTIGDFGRAGGNGFCAIRNKRYTRLIISPVNLASTVGSRYFRDLPLCSSQSDSLPVVPVQGGTVAAGREFRNGTAGRVLNGGRVDFTAFDTIASGTGGQTLAGSSATTQTFRAGTAAEQVWQVDDDGGPSFVDMTTEYNDDTAADFLPFPGTEAVADYVAIGMDAVFGKITLDNTGGTAGVGGVVTWEYWNGSAWAALTNVVDGTTGFTATAGANQIVTWDIPTDWATMALNSVTKFYVRAVIGTIYTTNPVYDQGSVAGLDWSTVVRPDGDLGIKQGDIIVIGNNNSGAIQPTAEAGTYRVESDPAAGVDITIERLDGQAFVFTAQSNVPFRVHIGSDADSAPVFVLGATGAGGYSAADAGGYSVPTRPITNAVGAAADGSYPLGELINPILVPAPITGDTAGPLSGLGGRLHPTVALAFVQATQGLNAPNDATIDAAYATSYDALVSDIDPISDINITWAARTSTSIRAKVKSNVLEASGTSFGRMGIIRPELTILTTSAVVSDTDPGVGANRAERVVYAWPGARTFIPEAVGTRLRIADGLTTFDGVLDIGWDSWVAALMSNVPPERNIGQAAAPVPLVLSGVRGFQRGIGKLEQKDFITMRQRGIAALRIDRVVGPILQSAVTTSLISGEKNIARRRMADFIQDSLARRLVQFTKLPLTQANKDSSVAEADAFMQELLSVDNPPAQRIAEFKIDDVSGNTLELEAKGIFVIIVRARTIASADFIVVQTEVGEGVQIQQNET